MPGAILGPISKIATSHRGSDDESMTRSANVQTTTTIATKTIEITTIEIITIEIIILKNAPAKQSRDEKVKYNTRKYFLPRLLYFHGLGSVCFSAGSAIF